MTISGYEIAFFTITFLVPGYIISSVMHLFVPRKVNVHQVEFFRWPALSAAAVGPIFIILFSFIGSEMQASGSFGQYALERPVLLSAVWFLAVFVWPLLISVALGTAGHFHLWGRMQDRLNLFPTGQLNTAWDRRFTETRKGG